MHTFPKSEKLCSLNDIEELFKKGSSNFLYPFRILTFHKDSKDHFFPKVLISIPKKTFKKAVDRNRLKRQIREIYRLHKHEIFQDFEDPRIPAFLGIIYVAKEKMPYHEMEKKLISVLLRLKN